MLGCVPVNDYRTREEMIWSLGQKINMLAHHTETKQTLKLVLGGCEFYDTVCGVKNIEYRTSCDVIKKLLTQPVDSVVLYHAFSKSECRPYLRKKIEGCTLIANGVHVKYPRVEVRSTGLTIAIKLGETLEYFNPHTKDPFAWNPAKKKNLRFLKSAHTVR